jgi:protein-disulfide isomerase
MEHGLPQERPPRRTRGSRSSAGSLLLPIIVLVVVAGLALAAFTGGGDAEDDRAPTDPAASDRELEDHLASLERREPNDPLAVGAIDAPVVMIEWADFQCPFCAAFARETAPELEPYLDDGSLRIEWRDLPLQGEESWAAAIAGRAAAEQDAFWELHDLIYAEDRERNAGELAPEALEDMAAELGLDVERFAAAMDDPRHQQAVEADHRAARELGITGTPAFLIDGRPLLGGQPPEVFVAAVEQALEDAGVP